MGKTTKEIMYRLKGHCSKTGTPKDMVGVPVVKLLRQWPIVVMAPPPISFFLCVSEAYPSTASLPTSYDLMWHLCRMSIKGLICCMTRLHSVEYVTIQRSFSCWPEWDR